MHFYLQWFVIYHDLSILDFLCSFYVAFMKANLYGAMKTTKDTDNFLVTVGDNGPINT
jgi:hypothetical protein